MDLWISHSNPSRHLALTLICLLTGGLLMFAFRQFPQAGTNQMAGFFLGVLLSGIGLWNLATHGRQTIIIAPRKRLITLEDTGLLFPKGRKIPFHQVTQVGIGRVGKSSSGLVWYFLLLTLTSGEEVALFAPGYCYQGATDRATVEGWQRRLQASLQNA